MADKYRYVIVEIYYAIKAGKNRGFTFDRLMESRTQQVWTSSVRDPFGNTTPSEHDFVYEPQIKESKTVGRFYIPIINGHDADEQHLYYQAMPTVATL